MILMETIEVARQAAEAGGDVVARYFREGVAMRSKESYNLVSDADLESEKAIVAVIQDAFPEHAVLGEESHAGDIQAENLWIVDPLDGTNNFAHKIPHFAVSVAYYHQHQPACGVVYNPLREDWYVAARGQGATWNERAIRVSEEANLNEALIGVGFYYDRGIMMEATLTAIKELFHQQIHGIRRFGTASLDLCHVATGMFGAFFEYELSPWDFAAARLILEEAGGTISTCKGEPLPLAKSSVLASNQKLHEAVRQIVQRHLPAGQRRDPHPPPRRSASPRPPAILSLTNPKA
jgi:myo-inositol-1(or 4)-monophosphatase